MAGTATMMAISIGVSAAMAGMQMKMAQQQAEQQAKIAAEQARAEYAAAEAKAKAEFAEANRQIAESQEKEIEDKADLIREANEELGTLRAGETALTEGSLGNLFFENQYQNSADLVRITENVDKQIDAQRAGKAATSQGYTNAVTIAKNNAQNTMVRANAASNSATLRAIGSTLQVAASANKDRMMIDAMEK